MAKTLAIEFMKSVGFSASSSLSISSFRQIFLLPFFISFGDDTFQKIGWGLLIIDILLTSACNSMGDFFYKIKSNDEKAFYKKYLNDFSRINVLSAIIAGIALTGSSSNIVLVFLSLIALSILTSSNLMLCKIRYLEKKNKYYVVTALCRIMGFCSCCVMFLIESENQYPVLYIILGLFIGEILLMMIIGDFKYEFNVKSNSMNPEAWTFFLIIIVGILIQKYELIVIKSLFPGNFSEVFVGVSLVMLFLVPLNMLFSLPTASLLSLHGNNIQKLRALILQLSMVGLFVGIISAITAFFIFDIILAILYDSLNPFLSDIMVAIYAFLIGVSLFSFRLLLKLADVARTIGYLIIMFFVLMLISSLEFKTYEYMVLSLAFIKASFLFVFLFYELIRLNSN
jgi:hypothetical protein